MARPAGRVGRVSLAGPLAPFAEAYSVELLERGYTPLTMVNQLRQVAGLSRWIEAGGVSVAELSNARVEEFLACRRAAGWLRLGMSRPGLLCLLDVLDGLGVLAGKPAVSRGSPIDLLLGSFERYLVSERGLAAGTIVGYLAHARWFVEGLGSGGLVGLSAAEVTGAVLRKADSGVSVSAAQNFVSGLRSFLRFCFLEGLLEADLSQAALVVRGRRASLLPRGVSPVDARALLDSCDRRRVLGRRDYALILLLLRLGLRRGEVARLTLNDIDWQVGELLIHGKGGRDDRLPLPVDVGQAIAAYLRRGRPASDRREVFLRDRAPYLPIDPSTVASTVRRACRRAGIPEVGSHRLRHTTACEMVQAGVPLVRIGQVLRHRSLQSTAIYARVDIEQLRQLAAPWPGGDGR